MSAYVISRNGEPMHVVWTERRANELAAMVCNQQDGVVEKREKSVDPLTLLVKEYFEFRGYKFPSPDQAFKFLVSEIGELADAIVHGESPDWVRNHLDAKNSATQPEVADVLMMLTAYCNAEYGEAFDPVRCLVEKFTAKGF